MIYAKLQNKALIILIFISVYSQHISAQIVPSDYLQNKSFTYDQTIDYYRELDKKYKHAWLIEKGSTDIGRPLHLFIMYGGKNFTRDVIERRTVPILLIMNGIHPGEPDGIDASLHLSEWVLSKNDSLLKNTCICIIPVYNVDGALNRGCCSRVNQDGPEQYGFRGNSKNLDLNRDFIKMDTKNTRSFVTLFQWLQPDLFIDTHVSNGADYQYTFTLLTTQKDKLEKHISDYLYDEILPSGTKHMNDKGWPVTPYINHIYDMPDSGLVAFYDSPRYSTGYTSLFNTPGLLIETHMLKPFPQRVSATLEFLKFASVFMHTNGSELKAVKNQSVFYTTQQTTYGLKWQTDTTQKEWIHFLGYEAGYKPSEVSGAPRLFYDRTKPFDKMIPMYWRYTCTQSCKKPSAYIIPQGWDEITERLLINGVKMERLENDQLIEVNGYRIKNYQPSSKPYEGRYTKMNTEVDSIRITKQFYKGDYVIKTGTRYDYFLASVLEPLGTDSYFFWGFFDGILGQKEWYSEYVWEDKAAEILENNPELRYAFEEKKLSDAEFAKDAEAQLYYVYRHSGFFETGYMQYPVYYIITE